MTSPAFSAMAPLLEMASASQNAATLRTVILKALADTEIFSGFDQLSMICTPILNDTTEGAVLLKTLELFSYGTMTDYTKAAPGTYLQLADTILYKLRQLTVLDSVQRACLKGQAVIHIPDDEGVLVSCIYAGLFQGQLCQTTQTLTLNPASPVRARDVASVQDMISGLGQLLDTLEATQSSLEATKEAVMVHKHAMSTQTAKAESGNNRLDLVSRNQKSNKRTRGDTTVGFF